METYQQKTTDDQDNGNDDDKRTLFCANLSEQVTEEILYELFVQAGPIEHVRIPRDSDGIRQKTFGFITYAHKCTIPYALQLYDGIKLFRRNLVIKARNAADNRYNQSYHNNDASVSVFNNYDRNMGSYQNPFTLPINPFAVLSNPIAGQHIGQIQMNMNHFVPYLNRNNDNYGMHDDYPSKHQSRSYRHNNKPYNRNNQTYDNRNNSRNSNQRRYR